MTGDPRTASDSSARSRAQASSRRGPAFLASVAQPAIPLAAEKREARGGRTLSSPRGFSLRRPEHRSAARAPVSPSAVLHSDPETLASEIPPEGPNRRASPASSRSRDRALRSPARSSSRGRSSSGSAPRRSRTTPGATGGSRGRSPESSAAPRRRDRRSRRHRAARRRRRSPPTRLLDRISRESRPLLARSSAPTRRPLSRSTTMIARIDETRGSASARKTSICRSSFCGNHSSSSSRNARSRPASAESRHFRRRAAPAPFSAENDDARVAKAATT